MVKQNGEPAGQYITFDDTLFSPFEKVIQIPAKDPGLGKGYVSPHVPLAKFDEWEKILPFYPHIPPAPRFHSNDWIDNLKQFSESQILRRVGSHLIANTLVALVIYLVYWFFPWALPVKMLSPIAHSLTGTVLGLLLVFRTNSAYARVYDARCIWGQLTNTIREMSRLAQTNMQGLDREHALMLTAALPTLMLNHLQSHGHENNNGYRNEQWSAAQKGVLTDLLSQHDFRCIWAAHTRPLCGGCAAVLCFTALLRCFALLYSALILYCCQVHLGCTQPPSVRRLCCFTLCFTALLRCFTLLYSALLLSGASGLRATGLCAAQR
jgi:hypothetical protein